jgi:hypothetical protein
VHAIAAAPRLNHRACQVSRGGPPPVGSALLRGDDDDEKAEEAEEAEKEEGGEPTEDGEGDVAEEDGAPPPPPTLEAQAGEELEELEFGEVPEGALTPQMEQMALKTSLVRERELHLLHPAISLMPRLFCVAIESPCMQLPRHRDSITARYHDDQKPSSG